MPLGTVISFSRLSPRKTQMIKSWFEAGTNAAVCNVTNGLSCTIDVYSVARLCFRGRERAELTPLILPIAGHFLKPGEAATLKVLMPPNTAPCRIEFCYHCLRDRWAPDWIPDVYGAVKGLSGGGFFYTDWIDPKAISAIPAKDSDF